MSEQDEYIKGEETERFIISCLYNNQDQIPKVVDILTRDMFSDSYAYFAFAAMRALHKKGEPIDIVTISEEAKVQQSKDFKTGAYLRASELVELLDLTAHHLVNPKYLFHHIEKLERVSQERKIKEYATGIVRGKEIEKNIERIHKASGIIKLSKRIETVNIMEEYADILKNIKVPDHDLVPYNIKELDYISGGVARKEVSLIAGRPNMGKTSLIIYMIKMWLAQGVKVLFISLDMTKSQLIKRLMSCLTNINFKKIRLGKISDAEHKKLMDTQKHINEHWADKIWIYDNILELEGISRAITTVQPDVVIIDFIQNIQRKGDSREVLNNIVRTLRHQCRTDNVAMLLLSQLNRVPEMRDDNFPRLADISESDYIAQISADALLLQYPFKISFNPRDKYKLKIFFAKTKFSEGALTELNFNMATCNKIGDEI